MTPNTFIATCPALPAGLCSPPMAALQMGLISNAITPVRVQPFGVWGFHPNALAWGRTELLQAPAVPFVDALFYLVLHLHGELICLGAQSWMWLQK